MKNPIYLPLELSATQSKCNEYIKNKFDIDLILENFPIHIPLGVVTCPVNNFGGVSWRMILKKDNQMLSIYLDCFQYLGVTADDKPYFEIYDRRADDTIRFGLNENKEFNEYIKNAFKNYCELK